MSRSLPTVPKEIKVYFNDAYMKASQWKLPKGATSDSSAPVAIKNAGVIGGGTMGRGIAIALCLAGYHTVLVEQDQKALDFCASELKLTLGREVKLKRFRKEDVARLTGPAFQLTTDFQLLSNSDLIIEAVFENMALKKELFGKLDRICPNRTIFGTNTSSLNIDEISSVLRDPTRLVGIHFFNPAHVIRMVEIVYGKSTSGTAVATAFDACQAMKKLPVLVGNCPSFVFNRLLFVYLNQAQKLLSHYGLLPKDVDAIVTSFGFLMGPITVSDMNGLDVMAKVKTENKMEFNILEREMAKRNRLGRKNGKGFYSYNPVSRKKTNDPEVEQLIRDIAPKAQTNIQLYSDSDVIEFLLFPMINEGFLCIEEGMIHEECLVDIMFILGFGWPVYTGGPMKWGRTKGLHRVAQKIQHWHNLEPKDRTYQLCSSLKKATQPMSKM